MPSPGRQQFHCVLYLRGCRKVSALGRNITFCYEDLNKRTHHHHQQQHLHNSPSSHIKILQNWLWILLIVQVWQSVVFWPIISWSFEDSTRDHSCNTFQFLFQSLNSVTGKTVHRFVGEIFQKLHSSRFTQMLYKRSKFRWDGSIIKGTLLGKQCIFSAVSCLPLVGSSSDFIDRSLSAWATCDVILVETGQLWRALYLERHTFVFGCISASTGGNFFNKHVSHPTCLRYKRRKFCCNRWIIKGTLLGEQSNFSSISRLLLGDVLETWHLTLYTH